MSKKIKTLVQKYEKDMQFENRFDELKHKLDLIPDPETKSEVITIKRKLMPAYSMMMVLLMLVTGLIGLQFGLNTNYLTGPERVDLVEEHLMELLDVYERESIESIAIDEFTKVQVYIGIKDGINAIVFILFNKQPQTEVQITINSNSIILNSESVLDFLYITDFDNVEISIVANHQNNVIVTKSLVKDYSDFYEYFGQ